VRYGRSRHRACGFTLVELLVVVAVVSLLVGLMLPALGSARDLSRTMKCASNLRQMVAGWMLYANDFRDRAMPLAYWSEEDIGSGEQVFWWGSHGTSSSPPDFARGFLSPYLSDALREGSVFECPSQPWGTYRPQGPSRSITSTYGYNGYYLSPSKTPGWAEEIGHRPWRRVADVPLPSSVLVFADALLPGAGSAPPGNTALLDPPRLFSRGGGGTWRVNPSPTTAFRHARAGGRGVGNATIACADGHVEVVRGEASWLTHAAQGIGSVGGTDGCARYVPDWEGWR
jgi:prepilin-type N-terminal cleavage/methylation domain-containing protein